MNIDGGDDAAHFDDFFTISHQANSINFDLDGLCSSDAPRSHKMLTRLSNSADKVKCVLSAEPSAPPVEIHRYTG